MYIQSPLRFFVIGFMALLAACSDPELIEPSQEAKPTKLMTVKAGSNANTQSLPAVVRSKRSTDLAFQVGGRIVTWNGEGGTDLRKGDVIAALDRETFRNAVRRAQAQFSNADGEYQRAKRLIEQDAISQSVLESRLAQREIAQAELDDARKDLADAVLRAPFDGYIGRSFVEQFQNVGAQAPIVTLQSSAVEAIVDVPSDFVLNANRVNYVDTYVELDAAPGRRFPATLRESTGQADQSTQTFEGRFEFKAPADLIVLTGMAATLYFRSELAQAEGETDIRVPAAAIMAKGKKQFVWVVKPVERSISLREIETGQGLGNAIQIRSGLKSGETIVAAGGAYLREGDMVRPWTTSSN